MNIQQLEEISYQKIAEFIASDRLEEANFLVNIIHKLKANASPNHFVVGRMPESYNYEAVQTLTENFAQPTAIVREPVQEQNYKTVLQQTHIQHQPSTYEWSDGYKDPRKDFWETEP